MRTNQARKTGPALLDRPVTAETTPRAEQIRRAPTEPLRTRREYPGAAGNPDFNPDDTAVQRSRGRGRRVRRGLIPQTRTGRIAAGVGLLLALAAVAAGCYKTTQFLRHDPRFRIASSSEIELQGNTHLSRSQLLSIFGEDVEGNLFAVPLRERRDELEQMPWVEHATVMRLLPNRLRVAVVERTPVAFVRQGSAIGMADRNGVLLDIPPDAPGNPNYSFPVVTGLKTDDTAESRERRMHLYGAFLHDLDSTGKKVSADLSEVDLSDPEDLKALLPSGTGGETLVHFGTGNFLHRYQRFEEHIAEWRTQYPRLSSVDMRYERQVVLQMPPKDSTVNDGVTEAAKPVDGAKHAEGVRATAAAQHGPAHRARPVAVVAPAVASPTPKPAIAPATTASTGTALPAPNRQQGATGKAAPVHRVAEPSRVADGASAKQADIAKRVARIKEWMARRKSARAAASKR